MVVEIVLSVLNAIYWIYGFNDEKDQKFANKTESWPPGVEM